MDAIDLNSRREDDGGEDEDEEDRDTIVNDLCSLKDVTLAENVGVLTLLPHSSTRNCNIQYSSALMNDNISKPLSSPVLELNSPCTLFPLTYHKC